MSDGTPTPTETVPSGGGAGGPVGVRGTVRAISAGIGLLLAGLVVSIVFGVAFTVPLILFVGEISGTVSFLALAAVGQVAFLVVGVVYVRRVGGVTSGGPPGGTCSTPSADSSAAHE